MQWDTSLETGEIEIDEQHRGLFALFDEVERAEKESGPEDVRRVLDHLTEYVAVHFALEENLMESEGLPADALAYHVGEHRALTDRTREMVMEYRTGQLSTTAPLVEFLCDWLQHHVSEVDRVLVRHVQSRRGQ